jgi:hypothetical protein
LGLSTGLFGCGPGKDRNLGIGLEAGPAFVPVGVLLVGVGEREDARFGEEWGGDLQSDGQAFLREAAGDGDHGQTIAVEGASVLFNVRGSGSGCGGCRGCGSTGTPVAASATAASAAATAGRVEILFNEGGKMADDRSNQHVHILFLEDVFIDDTADHGEITPAAHIVDRSCCVCRGEDAGGGGFVAASVHASEIFVSRRDFSGDPGVEQGSHADFMGTFGELVEDAERFLHGAGNLIVEMVEELRGDADAELGDGGSEAGEIVGNRFIDDRSPRVAGGRARRLRRCG